MTILLKTTTGLNAAFFQEIKDDNRLLKQLLNEAREILQTRHYSARTLQHLVESLSLLRDQLGVHFSLEEAYGYFDNALEVAPRLSERAEQLRDEHEILFLHLCDIVEMSERYFYRLKAIPLTISQIHRKIAQEYWLFFEVLSEHETNESELILQAFDEDLGVGD